MKGYYMIPGTAEEIDDKEQIINNKAYEIISLREGKLQKEEKHSDEWIKLYTKLVQECFEWINMNPLFIRHFRKRRGNVENFSFPYAPQLMKTVKNCLEGFISSKSTESGFIGYLSKSLSRKIKEVENKEKTNKKQEEKIQKSFDTPLNNGEGDSYTLLDVTEDDQTKTPEENYTADIATAQNIKIIFDLIELWYKKTKSGQEAKQKVCTYVVLKTLLEMDSQELNWYTNKYKFINQEAVQYFKKQKQFPTQKDFSLYSNIAETKYSNFKKSLSSFLLENQNIKAIYKTYTDKEN